MLSTQVLTRQNTGGLARYYEDGADDYYAKEGNANEWQGKGAEALGLEGEIDPARFRELLNGHVKEGVQISRGSTRSDAKERIGIDLTFSAPKSVSMQALVAGDPELIKAHDKAVSAALKQAELKVQARRKENGKSSVEHTANIIAAKFRHETSREQDPQLHTHAVIMNMTQRADGEWRAIKNDELVRAVKELGGVYQAELAKAAKEAGYELRYDKNGSWELAHITRQEIEHFSARGRQVEEKLAESGLTRGTASAEEKQQATLQTRARKGKVERDALYERWVERSKELGIDYNRREWKGAGYDPAEASKSAKTDHRSTDQLAKEAVRYAIKHISERDSVMTDTQLVQTALKHGQGRFSFDDVKREVATQLKNGHLISDQPLYRPAEAMNDKQDMTRKQWVNKLKELGLSENAARKEVDEGILNKRLVKQEARYTTHTARKREVRILAIEKAGRGQVAPLLTREQAYQKLEGIRLNSGQREAATDILTTSNRVVGIQGFAGVGKTTLLRPAKAELEAQGFEVRAVAPTGSQVKALQEAGIQAQTLAAFLVAKDKGLHEKTVLLLDEAGSVPTREMDRLMKLAEQSGSRLILAGDVAQTKAIEAGKPFHQLQEAGMATSRVEEIVRQQDKELKTAVQMAAHGRTAESLAKIKGVAEFQKDHERHSAIAQRYLSFSPEVQDKTLIVSGTNIARRELNGQIRAGLGLAGQGMIYDTLVRQDTTKAQRQYSHNYNAGDVIQPDQDYSNGLVRGETYRILDTGPGNKLTVQSLYRDEPPISFCPKRQSALSVYSVEKSELSVGDKVRITHNDARLDVANGDRFKVTAIALDKVTLSNEQRTVELPTTKPLHVDHGYASTVHASQGLTVQNVLVDAKTTSKTLTKDVWYVAISRATHSAEVYTDKAKNLPGAIGREAEKGAALDFERDRFRFEKPGAEVNRDRAGGGVERSR